MSTPDSQLSELGENPTAAQAAAVLRKLASASATSPPVSGDAPENDGWGVVEAAAPPEHLANITEDWSDATFRNLLESLPDAVVIINCDGIIVVVNQQTEDLFGYGRGELIGQPVEKLVPRRLRRSHVALRDRFLADPHVRPMGADLELWGERKDGTEVPVEISLSPLEAETGRHVIASIRDVTEKKRLVARYRTLVEEIPAVTFMASFDGGVSELYVSPQIVDLLGFTQKEWLENPVLWYSQLHEDDKERWHTEFARTCASAEPFRSVYRFIARDGRVVWVHGEARVVRDADGRPVFLQGVAFDITEQQEAARLLEQRVAERTAALAESEARTRMIVENALDAVITMDSAGVITGWNSQAEKTFGWSHEEVLGRRVGETIVPPGYRDAHSRGLEHFLTSGRGPLLGKRIEITALRRDGTEFPVALAISAVRSGGAYSFSAFLSDISERKEFLLAMQRSEEKYRLLVETTGTGYLILDYDLRVVDANTEFVRLSGHLTRRDILGRSVSEWTALNDRDRAAEQFRACQEEGFLRNLEVDYVDPDGKVIPVEINATLLQTDEGPRILCLCRDITERRQAREALARQARELERSNKDLDEFARAVSHDLKKPLGKMMRNAQRMERRGDQFDEKVTEHISSIIAGARHMDRLIEDIHRYSQVGQSERLVERIDCSALLEEVRSYFEPWLSEAGATLTVEPLPTLPAVRTDLVQVFQNLIDNAFKYRDDDRAPEVHVGVRREGDEWLFWVRDNGTGIEEEYRDRIFEFGERLETSIEGTGIGLANCKKAVERRGGRIWVESEPGRGSTFYFTLPAA
jgi:PAS domain S-box-containing protein